ncbi:MAG: hypothetical protein WCV73_02715 [Patescibacteria group bacterium]|jgi:hypothetical protein
MKKYLLILFLVLPLILSGCFFNKKQAEAPAITSQKYQSQTFEQFYFSAKYLSSWQLTETSTGNLGEFKDQIKFANKEQEILVLIAKQADKKKVLADYKIESQSQTQLNGTLATSYIGEKSVAGQTPRFEGILADNGPFFILIVTNNPGSQDYIDFVDSFAFAKISSTSNVNKGGQVALKIYFAKLDSNTQNQSCEAEGFKQVVVDRPDEDLGLIPMVMKLLLQLSVPEDLALVKLAPGVDLNTRLLSFGYENNKAIVNFDASLNNGGGSCLVTLKRSQIEKTLKALNEVSTLQIKQVEIQAAGDSASALQP